MNIEHISGKEFVQMDNLIGKVVRLHRQDEPKKVKLYLITEEHTSYFLGKVNVETVKEWMRLGLIMTFYNQDS
jgi:hypothetical protein